MTERPAADEATPYFFTYIDQVPPGNVVTFMTAQAEALRQALAPVSDAQSLARHQRGAWSIRETIGHVADTERMFLMRAFWFARGFDSALPSFDQQVAVDAAHADAQPWPLLIEDLLAVRAATLTFLRGLPAEAWHRRGQAGGNPITVRALAFLTAGHAEHHLRLLRERYAGVVGLP